MEKSKTQHTMPPDAYREFLGQVEIKNILMDSCLVKTNWNNVTENMVVDIKYEINYSLKKKNLAIITIYYILVTTKAKKKDLALKIESTYKIELLSKEPLSEEFMEIFTKINVRMSTWPYFREFVQGMLQRVGYPPLVLPLLKP